MSDYYARQTCLNGHIVSNFIGASFGTPQNHCGKCGEKAIIECPSCNTPQRGSSTESVGWGSKTPLLYCPNCGKPYPWTERQLAVAFALVNEEGLLGEEDKRLLTASLPDLVTDTPSTVLAATRFKRIVGNVGGGFKRAMYQFVVDVSSETAKKIVLGE
jgi:hypothetical protein